MFCLKMSILGNKDVLRRRGGKFLSQVAQICEHPKEEY